MMWHLHTHNALCELCDHYLRARPRHAGLCTVFMVFYFVVVILHVC